jgi:hypothetical protein
MAISGNRSFKRVLRFNKIVEEMLIHQDVSLYGGTPKSPFVLSIPCEGIVRRWLSITQRRALRLPALFS